MTGPAATPGPPSPVRPVVMGVVNVTPDSFSDGGEWFDEASAISHGLALRSDGAQILDVGGESTRPGSARVPADEELRRVLPVVRALAAEGCVVSIDTMRARVAAAALEAGAAYINDVSGGLADPDMAGFAAGAGVPYIAMHWRGHGYDMQTRAVYDDVRADVLAELTARRDAFLAAGGDPGLLVLDPGIGFAKLPEHNWTLLRHLDDFTALGHRVLLGTSRKTFLGSVGRRPGAERAPKDRDVATAATSLYAAQHRIWGVRVHDVASTVDALDVAEQLLAETPDERVR